MFMALGQVLKNLLLYFHPKGVFYQFPSLFRSTWYQSMATNKDRIEKLESEMQKLKESMQKKSQSLGSSMCEIKKMLSKSRDKIRFSLDPKIK